MCCAVVVVEVVVVVVGAVVVVVGAVVVVVVEVVVVGGAVVVVVGAVVVVVGAVVVVVDVVVVVGVGGGTHAAATRARAATPTVTTPRMEAFVIALSPLIAWPSILARISGRTRVALSDRGPTESL